MNEFDGSIPTEYGALTSLEELHLRKSKSDVVVLLQFLLSRGPRLLQGTHSTYLLTMTFYDQSIIKLIECTHTHTGGNNLKGRIPTEIGLLADSLSILDLGSGGSWFSSSGNAFTGSIPSEIGLLTRLKELILGQYHVVS